MSGFLKRYLTSHGLKENAKQGERQYCSKNSEMRLSQTEGLCLKSCLRDSFPQENGLQHCWKVMPIDLQEESRRKEQV